MRPAPMPVIRTSFPGSMRPSCVASARARGIEPEEVLPKRSTLTTTFSLGKPSFFDGVVDDPDVRLVGNVDVDVGDRAAAGLEQRLGRALEDARRELEHLAAVHLQDTTSRRSASPVSRCRGSRGRARPSRRRRARSRGSRPRRRARGRPRPRRRRRERRVERSVQSRMRDMTSPPITRARFARPAATVAWPCASAYMKPVQPADRS